MPNTRQYWAPYVGPFASVETFHQNPLFDPGQAGNRVIVSQVGATFKEYQLCQVDSGCTASTPTGALLTGQLLYWKDRTRYLVTNDSRFTDLAIANAGLAARNSVQSVAGVLVNPSTSFPSVVVPSGQTGGDWVYLQTKGRCTVILSAQASPTAGDFVIPNNSATVPQVNNSAVGTAPGDTLLGRYISSTVVASVAQVDLQIPEIP
jgi:hypothetical protein